ncbi:TolC family outer membrane protein [Pseudomonas oryzihabitans]|uniref:TolC family outer membrane protein n=1 Tax=Pseudomonas oryzihabitans TaxID=47885 RepID=UPI0011AB0EE8|nr:TolC family outer membrane protein [Pseudomonas oryzihabitans]
MSYRLKLLPIVLVGWMTAASSAVNSDSRGAPSGYSSLLSLFREVSIEAPRLQAIRARTSSAQEKQSEAFGALLPQISAQGSYNKNRQHAENFPSQSYDGQSYILSLNQVIYNRSTWQNYQKYKLLAKQKIFEAQDAESEIAADLAERYFKALASEDQLALVQAEWRATNKNYDRVKALYSRQLATITDRLEIEARLDTLVAAEIDAKNQIKVTRENLSELVGRTVLEPLERINQKDPFIFDLRSISYWADKAMVSSPALAAKQKAQESVEAAIREAQGGHLPTVSLSLNAQNTNLGYQNTQSPKTDTLYAGVNVQIPIFSGGSTSARVRGLMDELDASEYETDEIRKRIKKEVSTAVLNADSGLGKIKATRQALYSSHKARLATEKSFEYQTKNTVDVLDSIREEYSARRDYLQAQYNYFMSMVTLYRWSGRLSDAELSQLSAWLTADERSLTVELDDRVPTRTDSE